MSHADFLTSLVQALFAALVGGWAARALRLPPLVGYLLAGVVVGPHTPGLYAHKELLNSVEKLGITLLMFAVGTHFSLRELLAAKRFALIGGGVQIAGTILLGLAIGIALGWGAYGGLFLGCALSLSSTAVTLRLLEERGELNSAHGALMLGVLVMQDLSVALMIALLPSLATLSSEGGAAMTGVGIALLKAAGFIAAALLVAVRVVPYLLERVARTDSQELFLLVVMCVCLASAYLADRMGLSLEIGAFFAGIVISESEYAYQAFADVRPLRDVFAALFFVWAGMLLNVPFALARWPVVLTIVLGIVLGKSLITFLAMYALGAHGRAALLVGLGLAQIGEFSFVLTSIGSSRGLISETISNAILAAALVSLFLAPFLYAASGRIYAALNGVPLLSELLNRAPKSEPALQESDLADARVLILGGGRVGSAVSEALQAKEIPHIVADYSAKALESLREKGVRTIYGDASSEEILKKAASPSLELAVVALPETSVAQRAIRLLKRLDPQLPVIVRVHREGAMPVMRESGADDVYHAEFETAVGMIRSGLHRLGRSPAEIEDYVGELRRLRDRRASSP
jgi:CPA2 family monovalent cation:H+ antiporter-2